MNQLLEKRFFNIGARPLPFIVNVVMIWFYEFFVENLECLPQTFVIVLNLQHFFLQNLNILKSFLVQELILITFTFRTFQLILKPKNFLSKDGYHRLLLVSNFLMINHFGSLINLNIFHVKNIKICELFKKSSIYIQLIINPK